MHAERDVMAGPSFCLSNAGTVSKCMDMSHFFDDLVSALF